MEAVSFRIDDDFRIVTSFGERAIPRLKFRDAKKVLEEVARITTADRTAYYRVIAAATSQAKSGDPGGVPDAISRVVGDMIVTRNHDDVKTVLGLLAANSLDDIVDDMLFAEVVGVVKHLFEGNFGSLKNLFASLQAMTTSGQNEPK